MAYATFTDYTDEYKGRWIPDAVAFDPLAADASNRMDAATSFRLCRSRYARHEAVMKCCCAVADALFDMEQAQSATEGQGVIASEKVDEHTISYDTSKVMTKAQWMDSIDKIIRCYLRFTGLVNSGVVVRMGRLL